MPNKKILIEKGISLGEKVFLSFATKVVLLFIRLKIRLVHRKNVYLQVLNKTLFTPYFLNKTTLVAAGDNNLKTNLIALFSNRYNLDTISGIHKIKKTEG
jgi:hypothetical protein